MIPFSVAGSITFTCVLTAGVGVGVVLILCLLWCLLKRNSFLSKFCPGLCISATVEGSGQAGSCPSSPCQRRLTALRPCRRLASLKFLLCCWTQQGRPSAPHRGVCTSKTEIQVTPSTSVRPSGGCRWVLGSSRLCPIHHEPGHMREVYRVEVQRLWPAGEGKTHGCWGSLAGAGAVVTQEPTSLTCDNLCL